jgi:hypothetical protein
MQQESGTINAPNETALAQPAGGIGWMKLLGVMLATVVLTTAATVWAIKTFLFASAFEPVELSANEERVLEAKLDRLERAADAPAPPSRSGGEAAPQARRESSTKPLEPEPYREDDADREITLTERELNALLAKNTDLASKVAIDLADDLISAKVLIPVDPDFPMVGGTTLRVRAGLTLAYEGQRPVVVVRGVSLMGVPVPSAWMGGLKHVDLVERYGGEAGFWKAFAAGVENMRVGDGTLSIKLKE